MGKNSRNQQYRKEVVATADVTEVVDTVVEEHTNIAPVEEVKELTEVPAPEVVEEEVVSGYVEAEEQHTPVVEPIPYTPVEEVKEVVEPVKEVKVEAPVQVEPVVKGAKYRIVVGDRVSPLAHANIIKRLATIGEQYHVDEKTNVITTKVFATYTEAVNYKKYLIGKGLKPTVRVEN